MERQPTFNQDDSKIKPTKTKNKKILGYFLIIAPILGLILTLIAYTLTSVATSPLTETSAVNTAVSNINAEIGADETQNIRGVAVSIVNFILGFLGIICVIGILVGVPVGVLLIAKDGKTGKFSMKEAVKFGWSTMKKNFWLFAGIIAISVVINYLPTIVEAAMGQGKKPDSIYVILTFASWILGTLIAFGWKNVGLKLADNKPVKIPDVFPPLLMFLKYIGGTIIYSLIVLGGTILLIVPGIIWSIKFGYYPYFILEGSGPMEAIKKSGQITQGSKADIFIFNLLLGLINFAGALALLVGLFATIPATTVASAFVYRKLQSQVATRQN